MPSYNPVPATEIPGTRKSNKPTSTYRKSADAMRALNDLLPYLTNTSNASNLSTSLADLEIAQQTSEPYQKLMLELYAKYGPELNKIGSEINKQNSQSEIDNNLSLMQGSGKDLVALVDELQRLLDPEFYKGRELTFNRLAELLNSIDLSGGLSETERREIEQGLAREGNIRGTANAPSNLDAVSNAMQYGAAGRNRVLQNQNALTQAINASTAFLPSSKSGFNSFNIATGKTNDATNSGNALFTGVATPSTAGQAQGANMYNNYTDIQKTKMMLDSQKASGMENFGSVMSGVSSLLNGIGNYKKGN